MQSTATIRGTRSLILDIDVPAQFAAPGYVLKRKLVEIRTAPSFQASVPRDLFPTPRAQGSDVARDGQRMMVNMPAAETAPTPMTLVLNWMEGLKK
jgi:hypothetical protein